MHQHYPTALDQHEINIQLYTQEKAETIRCLVEMRDLEHASEVVTIEFATQILSPQPSLQTTNYLI